MTEYLYRVRIVEYPEGAMEPRVFGTPDEYRVQWTCDHNWSPPGWEPSRHYVATTGMTRFTWPKAGTPYRCRTTAEARAELLNSFGAKVIIERSSEITWPGEGAAQAEEAVAEPENQGGGPE